VLYRYLNEFDIFYGRRPPHQKRAGAAQIDVSLASHLDACRVVAAAVKASANPLAQRVAQDAVKLVLGSTKG